MARIGQRKFRKEQKRQEAAAERQKLASVDVSSGEKLNTTLEPTIAAEASSSVSIEMDASSALTAVHLDADGFYDLGDEGVEDGDEEWAASFAADRDDEGGDVNEIIGEVAEEEVAENYGYDYDDGYGFESGDPILSAVHAQPAAQRTMGYDLGGYTGAFINEKDRANIEAMTAAKEVAEDADAQLPGVARNRNKKRKRMGNDSEEERARGQGPAVLPVATLPDDWDGQVLDGAMYLATVQRASQTLPHYTRADNPYEAMYPVELPQAGPIRPPSKSKKKGKGTTHVQPESDTGAPRPARHPALPKESWTVLFPLHFKAYKERIERSWPPTPSLPYPSDRTPVPDNSSRLEWTNYINGWPRKWIKVAKRPAVEHEDEEADMELDEEEEGGDADQADVTQASPVANDMDEEAMMNASEDVQVAIAQRMKQEEADKWEEILEPVEEKHMPREPAVSALQHLSTQRIISILCNMSYQIAHSLEACEAELDVSSLTQPETNGNGSTDVAGSANDPSKQSPTHQSAHTPLNERYARWIFALLLILESPLSATQTSALRELARVIMRVGAWRWVKAVMAGEVGLPAVTSVTSATSNSGEPVKDDPADAPVPWVFGARWKYHRDIVPPQERRIEAALPGERQDPPRGRSSFQEADVDETLARCWMLVYAIASGWAQWDLVADLENMFS